MAGEPFVGRVSKISINLEEIILRAPGNFVAQNKVLEPPVIIINYCIITINVYCNYNYIINAW
jgi:hypothetical protein